MPKLDGRIAAITGGAKGLGKAAAIRLAAEGAQIAIVDLADAKDTCEEIKKQGGVAEAWKADVTQDDQVNQAFEAIGARFGRIDILVNNAGIHRRAPLLEMTESQWREVVDTNLTSAFLVTRAVAPRMIARGAGKIINTCSLMSEVGRPTIANYAAAKGGLKMLTRSMCVEWAKHNLQINGIGPGYFETELTKPLVENPEFNQWICSRTPAGRWGKPDELVGAAVFLASRASGFVNGQVIYVDGGVLAAL